ncbi:hypothetical protein [Jeotgalibaca sp. A127]|uniref:hypothetical protein n=1 Tax=Jeotgalibaca sp. A127 TaxID=3457324 RepID=UPI003FCF1DD5
MVNDKKIIFHIQLWFLLLVLLGACGPTQNEAESSEVVISEEMTAIPMNEEVTVAKMMVLVSSAYSTNIFINREFGMAGQPLEEVIDGTYLFMNVKVTNYSDSELELSQRFGVLGVPEDGYIWPKFADMTEQVNKNDVTYHLDEEFYDKDMTLGAGKTKEVQLFIALSTRAYPVSLVLFDPESGEPIEMIEIISTEEWYVISNMEAQELIEERFPSSRIVAKEIMGYQFEDEAEGGFYYPFEVTTDGNVSYYFVKRDTSEIYSATFDERYADYPAVPGEIVK